MAHVLSNKVLVLADSGACWSRRLPLDWKRDRTLRAPILWPWPSRVHCMHLLCTAGMAMIMLRGPVIRQRALAAWQGISHSRSFTRASAALRRPVHLSQHFVPTLRAEESGHEHVESVIRLLRGGYIRQSSSGFFTLLPNGLRIVKKIERMIDGEMAGIGASKLEMPIVLSSALWHKSGRFDTMGSELYRLKDRRGTEFVLGPTYEEEITRLVGDEVHSWRQLPVKVYQITQKHRDEPRPRSGLLRTRGFLMKDLYTFDIGLAEAESSYEQVRAAYDRIMTRLFGQKGNGWRVAQADSGAMGGLQSHEYQVADELGEDTLLSCDRCHYSANSEMAASLPNRASLPSEAGQVDVHLYGSADPSAHGCTMTAVISSKARQLNPVKVQKAVRSVQENHRTAMDVEEIYPGKPALTWDWNDRPEGPMIRFDRIQLLLDNECSALEPDEIEEAVLRSIEQYGSPSNAISEPISGRAAGAPTLHDYFGAQLRGSHDPVLTKVMDMRQTEHGDTCAACRVGKLSQTRTVEVGHTFLLGTRYSTSLEYKFATKSNEPSTTAFQMGCYGIGLTRIFGVLAQLASRRFDALATSTNPSSKRAGFAWDADVAPFRVLILPLDLDNQKQAQAVKIICEALQGRNAVGGTQNKASVMEALLGIDGSVAHSDIAIDDRVSMSFGTKLNESDLVGYPFVMILGKHFNSTGEVEVRYVTDQAYNTVHVPLDSFSSS